MTPTGDAQKCETVLDSKQPLHGYKTAKGVNRGIAGIKAMGGTVHLVGDFEVMGHVPWDRIEDALKLIKVSRLNPGRTDLAIKPLCTHRTAHRIARNGILDCMCHRNQNRPRKELRTRLSMW